jgi:hypothetical protein
MRFGLDGKQRTAQGIKRLICEKLNFFLTDLFVFQQAFNLTVAE